MERQSNLTILREKRMQKDALEGKLAALREQRSRQERTVISLRAACRQEQEDVEKLEKRSLANYLLNAAGKLEERKEQERREVRAAAVHLTAAEQELEQTKQAIRETQSVLAELRVAEQEYAILREAAIRSLRESNTIQGQRLRELEQQITVLEGQKREIQEAMSVGNRARGTADRILSALESADDWNTWDLIGGGGLVTHVAKHGHLEEAQELVGELRSDLRRFQTELTDIRVREDLQVNVDGVLRFADWFFDGLFADWAVGKEISQSQESVQHTRNQISEVLGRLRTRKDTVQGEIAEKKKQLDALLLEVENSM